MHLDVAFLSRIQFAFTIAFHILFPAFSIGMASFLALMEGAWLKTGNSHYLTICKFWTKIFALTFGMGIVSGLVMEFQLGTNWAGFTYAAGPVLGALFTYEVLTAFFIEAGFLGVMIFGWERVSPKLHYVSTLLVVAGVSLSAFWILAANSWMQTPAGAEFHDGRFFVDSWLRVIFNPSLIPRFLHMLIAAWLTTALAIAGIHAYYLLRRKHLDVSKTCLKFAVIAVMILAPLQIFMGDRVGLRIHQYQPLKTAAIESVWQTQRGAPFLLFAIPDQKAEKNLYSLGIPHMASLINTHQWNGELTGLKSVAPQDQPYVAIVFFSFRIMLALGFLMLLSGIIGVILLWRHRLFNTDWYLKFCVLLSPAGFIAILTGWFTAETGRQPYVIYNFIRTLDAYSNVALYNLIISLSMTVLVYGIVFGVFYFRYFGRILSAGPKAEKTEFPFNYLPQPQAYARDGER